MKVSSATVMRHTGPGAPPPLTCSETHSEIRALGFTVNGGGHEERSVCILCLETLRSNKLRIHLETLHASHMHVFFLVELYHVCNKVIIIELICSLFLKKYRLMEECSDKCHQKYFN